MIVMPTFPTSQKFTAFAKSGECDTPYTYFDTPLVRVYMANLCLEPTAIVSQTVKEYVKETQLSTWK